MNDLITEIKKLAAALHWLGAVDSIQMDKELGEIEALIYSARQMISDEWRAARQEPKPKQYLDLEELGL